MTGQTLLCLSNRPARAALLLFKVTIIQISLPVQAVAVQAVAAALIRIASGANMKGMVRMGSSSALHALHVGLKSEVERPMHEDENVHKPDGMSIHRIQSRSGQLSSMVKVASFGNLGNIRNVSSLSDLHHAGTPGKT